MNDLTSILQQLDYLNEGILNMEGNSEQKTHLYCSES